MTNKNTTFVLICMIKQYIIVEFIYDGSDTRRGEGGGVLTWELVGIIVMLGIDSSMHIACKL
jgi:hypothetical protein